MTRRVQLHFDQDDGMTKQSFRDECDINFIMNKWKRTGELPPESNKPLHYGDFTNVDDYLTAQNRIIEADQAFLSLPSWMRKRFQNDPNELLRFLSDPANQAEAVKMGLANSPEPDPTPPAPEPDPPPAGD